MDRRVASGAVTSSQANESCVLHGADVKASCSHRAAGGLRVATKTKIIVASDEEVRVDRTVRLMANRAAIAQRFVFERVRLGLLAMTLTARLVQPRHRQPAGGFHDVHPMRVVALHTIHLFFQ